MMAWYKVAIVQKPQAEGVNTLKTSLQKQICKSFYIIIFPQVKLLKLGLCRNSLRP